VQRELTALLRVHPLNTNGICAPQDFPKPYEIYANHIVMICVQ
jgi:hypothetical protein